MYTIEKWRNAHLQPIDLASNEEGITTASCSEESTIEQNNQHNPVKRKFAYLIPRKGTPVEVEVDKEMEDVQTNASNVCTVKQEEMLLDEEVCSCTLQMEDMISSSRREGTRDSQWAAEMEVEYEMQVGLVLEPLLKIQEELLKEIEICEMPIEKQVVLVKNEEQFELGLNSLSKIQKELAVEIFHVSKFPFESRFRHRMPTEDWNSELHVADASGMIHHQLRPPDEVVDDMREFSLTHENHQPLLFKAMMKEEKQETGLHSKVLIPKAEPLPLPAKRKVMPGRLDSKRKPKAKKKGSSADNTSFLGHIIHGVVDGSFDAGYLLTVRVGDTDTVLRGLVFEPGLCVPISEVNDIAPNVKLTQREKNVPFSEALHATNAMTHGQHGHNTMLPAPVSNAVASSYFATLEKIGSERINMECCQQLATPSQSTSISEDISRLPSSVTVPNLPVVSSLSVKNQIEPPANVGSDQTYALAIQMNAGPSTTTFISKADSRLSSAAASVYGAFKSVKLQGQMEFPAMIGAAKTNIVPQPGAIPSKFTTCSQLLPVSIPIPDAVATSSVPVQTETKLSATTKSGQTDMLTSPDTTSSKSTSISEAGTGFTSSMCKLDASAASSIHAQNQLGYTVCFGSCQTDMANTQPDPVPLKCTSMGIAIPSLISEADTGFTSFAASSICAQNQMGHSVCFGSCQTDTTNPQSDPVSLKPHCASMGVSIPSLMSGAYATQTASNWAEKMEPPKVTGSSQTDVMVPQGNAIPLTPLFVSQAFSCIPSTLLTLDNLSESSDNALNQVAAPMMSSGQSDVAFSQHNAIPSKFISVSQDMPVPPIPMFVQYTQATSVLQDKMESAVLIASGQTGKVFSQSDVILPKHISVPKDSSYSEKVGHSDLSEQVCDSIKVTGTQMDVDKGKVFSQSDVILPKHISVPKDSSYSEKVGQKFISVSQDMPVPPIPMFVQYTQATSVLQDKMESAVLIASGQTGKVFSQSDVILPKHISVPKDSSYSEKVGHSDLSEQVCDSIKGTGTQMDVDKGA
ncbi:hypothetical protein SUGI_0328280 [Cryptomeria japonica]|nr:hypothetical protein SUGI_0328280 [Cryptomeria japonica]